MGCETFPAGPAREACLQSQKDSSGTSGSDKPAHYSNPYATNSGYMLGVNVPKRWDQVWVNTTTPAGIMGASDVESTVWNARVDRNEVPAFFSLPANEQAMFNQAAKAIHPLKKGSTLYDELADEAYNLSGSGQYRSPQSLLFQMVQGGQINLSGSGGSGGRGGGGGGGGGVAPQPADQSIVRRSMDSLARDLIGRTLSDDEFGKYYGAYTSSFAANPAVDQQQHGIDALKREDDYQEYQVVSKFAQAMDAVIKGVAK